MRWLGRWTASAALTIASFVPAAMPSVACAAEGARAALVVDTGESVHRFCVSLPEDEVSGTELIVLAAEQHGLSYRFGYGGDAVCMLAGVGTEGDDCFERYPDFWGYWRGDGSGGWAWSGTGGGSTRVSDGDVEGWSWGSGSDGSSHPAPPTTSFSSVCPAASSPPPSQPRPKAKPRRPRSQPRPSGQAAGVDARPSGSSGDASRERTDDPRDLAPTEKRKREEGRNAGTEKRPRRREPVVRPSPTPEAVIDALDDDPGAAASASDREGGPPPAGVAAVLAAGLLGGAGTWITRRRRTKE